MTFKGKTWKYGNNVDTDVIIPGKYVTLTDPKELGKHCLEGLDPQFVTKIKPGDILMAERNFGCGSSREMAPIAIKASGVSCVIASSFARIFYRNAINIGLPIFECSEAVQGSDEGDEIEVDSSTGTIANKTKNRSFKAVPFPPFIQEIIDAGGLIKKTAKELARRAASSACK